MSESDYIKTGRELYNRGAFFISSVKRDTASGRYTVEIEAGNMLLPHEMEAVKRLVICELESSDIGFEFDFVNAVAEVMQSDDCDFLKRLFSSLAPELAPVLSLCGIERCDSDKNECRYVLHAAPMFKSSITTEYVNELRTYASETYNWSFSLEVASDEYTAAELASKLGIASLEKTDPAALANIIAEQSSGINTAFAADAKAKVNSTDGASSNAQTAKRQGAKAKRTPAADVITGKEISRPNIVKMCDFTEETGTASILGSLLGYEYNETRDKSRWILKLNVSDKTNSLPVKLFPEAAAAKQICERLDEVQKSGDLLLIRGSYKYDSFTRDHVFFANDINIRNAEKRMDTAPEGQKRVELHLHTQMSAMDGLTKVNDVIATAKAWGHRAVAITDHGVVHSLPFAMKAAKKNDIKVIFGCEGYLLDDSELHPLKGEYSAVAITAAHSGSGTLIYDLAAVRFDEKGKVLSAFRTVANPASAAPRWMKENCGLNDDEILNAPVDTEAVGMLLKFIGGSSVVVYCDSVINDIASAAREECDVPYRYIDISRLELNLHLDIKNYSMESGCAPISARYAEPPVMPAEAAAMQLKDICCGLFNELESRGITEVPHWDRRRTDLTKLQRYHIILLAADITGLKNLYKLVSYSHLQYFHRRPCMPRSMLYLFRNGIILGSACEAGELFRSVTRGLSEDEQLRIASWYDYLEIQPIANNAFMIRSGAAADEEALRDFNRRILALGDKLNRPVVATCDVHFLDPDDAIFRSILMHAHGFSDAEQPAPLYFRTTDEMLEEFSYLGEERAYEVVVENPNRIADMVQGQLHPFLDEKFTYSPELPNAKEELESRTMGEAHRRYGEKLPEIVQKRLDKELKSIIGNGYSSLYMVAQKLVAKSLGDGYLVGSRGSVGSSFVATMLGITEVNSLPPHYLCPECKYSEFVLDAKSRCGIDLPDKLCPNCGAKLKKEGYDIPFEVFLGFKGDKTPDIDLNFSGDYQPVAHRFTEEMFGPGHAFRAGTISAVQDKTVYGYVKHYCEDMQMHVSEAETNRLVSGCLGVKKTTGQHPGGIVIVPEDYEIFDFCPVQHPADKNDSGSVTTHFDFHALDDKLVKLDILGHDDPTVLKMLHDLTGLDPRSIPLDDPDTMAIYSTDKSLNISLSPLDCDVGSLGIPEFGTGFVRGMLMETRPTTMEELVRIAGLSHGTDVWNNNAQVLVENGTATLMEVICTRDDIMNYLISKGGDPSLSFKTMEKVRKGKGLEPEMEKMMNDIEVPGWFIDSCKKIQYMFPRAHAAAYVMMSFRVAYYKVHYPLEFYAVYFTVRADTFDIELCYGGLEKVLDTIKTIKKKDNPDQKEKDAVTILEVVAEMNMRGFELLPVDIYKSKAKQFTIEDGKLRPPFTSIAGLGENVAIGIENAAKDGEYLSKEDFAMRTKANSAVLQKLTDLGCLDILPDSNQIKLF